MISGAHNFSDVHRPLRDHVALVTGGSRGIGAATALLLGRYGARVAVNYVQNEAAAQEVVSAIEQAGSRAFAVQANAANAEQVERMVRSVTEALGPIDTLILNAPAFSTSSASSTLSASEQLQAVLAPFTRSKWDVLESFVRGQLQSTYYPSQAVLPMMIKQRRGSIVFVTATTARRPESEGGGMTIAIGKASVESMIRSMAQELGPFGIRVNAVGAGHIITDLNAGTPQEKRDQLAQATPLAAQWQARRCGCCHCLPGLQSGILCHGCVSHGRWGKFHHLISLKVSATSLFACQFHQETGRFPAIGLLV